jgi:hypothetical protein
MSDPLRLLALGEHAERVRNRLTALTGAELVEDLDCAELVVMTPEDLAELIEDAAATAAYHRTRNQERLPIGVVDRLIAGETRSGSGANIAVIRCANSPSRLGSVSATCRRSRTASAKARCSR